MNATTAQQSNTALLERPQTVRPEVNDELLADIARRIVAEFHPYRIILFGSYAYGTPHADSDVDLLVIMDKLAGAGRVMPEIKRAAYVPNLEMDILTYSPAELETRLAMNDFFIVKIMERGRTLYDCGKMWDKPEITIIMSLFDEWVGKAEMNYQDAIRLRRYKINPSSDSVCFNCQQCVEKYLKSFLMHHNATPPYTHDLNLLLRLCIAYDVALQVLTPVVPALDRYAVDPRYPGYDATVAEAQTAVETMKTVRKLLRKSLGL